MNAYQAKIIIIGDSGVGKTSMCYRLVNNLFLEENSMTIGVDYSKKELTVFDPESRMKCKIVLQIWDTAGSERFDAIVTSFYRGVHGILCVFDLSQPDSFHHIISRWIPSLLKYCPHTPILMVGNKQELMHLLPETNKLAQEYCQANQLPLVYCSCQTGQGVTEAFVQLVDQVVEKYKLSNLCKPTNFNHHMIFELSEETLINNSNKTINNSKKYYCC